MAHVVIAWELGAGFGHLVAIAAIGAALRDRGHEVTVLLHPTPRAGSLLRLTGLAMEEQPTVPAPARSFPLSVNYSANLLRNGFWDSGTVRHRVTAWRDSIARLKPDLLLCDYAPSALLATRGKPYPRVAIGTGFTVPALGCPMPALQPWFSWPVAPLAAADGAWLESVNQALKGIGITPLDSVASLFDGVSRLLCVEPELDHYSGRQDDHFVGGMEPPRAWLLPGLSTSAPERFAFLYLSERNRFLPAVLSALEHLDWPVLAYVGGAGPEHVRPASGRVTYLAHPVDLSTLADRCVLAVTQGGTMLSSFLTKRDLPLLVCPEDLDKAVSGFRLAQQGLGRTLNWLAPIPHDLAPTLEALASGATPLPHRRAFAARYGRVSGETVAARAADYCVRLLEGYV